MMPVSSFGYVNRLKFLLLPFDDKRYSLRSPNPKRPFWFVSNKLYFILYQFCFGKAIEKRILGVTQPLRANAF